MKKTSYLRRVLLKQSKKLWPTALVEMVLAVLISYINVEMMDLINEAVGGVGAVKKPAIILLILVLALVPFRLIYSKLSTRYIRDSLIRFRKAYLEKLFKKDINEFREENNGVYLSQLTNDINTLEQALFQPQLTILNAIMNYIYLH